MIAATTVVLTLLPRLILASPIPRTPITSQLQPPIVYAASSQFYEALTDSASAQYTAATIGLSTTQQIIIIICASFTVTLMIIIVAVVVIGINKKRLLEKEKLKTFNKSVKEGMASSPTFNELRVNTSPTVTLPKIPTNNSPIFPSGEPTIILKKSPIRNEASESDRTDLKLQLYQKMASPNKIPDAPKSFFTRSLEIVLLGENTKSSAFGGILDRFELENVLTSLQGGGRGVLSVQGGGEWDSSTANVLSRMTMAAPRLNVAQSDEEIYKTASELSQVDMGTMKIEKVE